MHGNMIRPVALDFVLRLIAGGMTRVAFVVRILRMDLDDPAADMPGLGIPGDVIAFFETCCHLVLTRKPTGGFNRPAQTKTGGLGPAHPHLSLRTVNPRRTLA